MEEKFVQHTFILTLLCTITFFLVTVKATPHILVPKKVKLVTNDRVQIKQGDIDPHSGFIIDEGFFAVRANCTTCHSAQLVIQNRGSRQQWKLRIKWMQDKHGLWPLASDIENKILFYLTKNYGIEKQKFRRKPLAKHLLP